MFNTSLSRKKKANGEFLVFSPFATCPLLLFLIFSPAPSCCILSVCHCSCAYSDSALRFDIDGNGSSHTGALKELKVPLQFCDSNDLSQRVRHGGPSFSLRTWRDLIPRLYWRHGGAQPNKCRTCTVMFCALLREEEIKYKSETKVFCNVVAAVTVKPSYL